MRPASPSAVPATGSRLQALMVYVVAAALSIGWSWWAGKDPNWDFVNYHLYLGRSAWADRWSQDFFAASIQSYLNPYAYAPVAAMVQWGWRDLLIASILAAVHAVNALLVWLIAGRLLPVGFRGGWYRGAAVLLAVLAPVFLQQIGGSFADVTTAIPCLLACYLLLDQRVLRGAARRRLFIAGMLLGTAAGLKLTNAPFVVALMLGVFLCWGRDWARGMRTAAWAVAGSALGFATVHGYWGWRLYDEFGNPFFPFFNGLFQSPDYLAHSLFNFRFVQHSALDALTYLFRMALPERMLYTEPAAPDVRMAVALVLLSGLALRLLWERLRVGREERVALSHVERAFFLSLVGGVVLWLATSANGRYAMPILLLLGPLIVWAWIRLTGSMRWASYGIGAVLLVQLASTALGSDFRWNDHAWGGTWLNVEVPQPLREQPHLFLSFDLQSHSFLAAYVHPASGFVNVGGQYVIGPTEPGFDRLRRLMSAHPQRVRTLIGARVLDEHGQPKIALEEYAGRAARLGLEVDASDCLVVKVRERLDKLDDVSAAGRASQVDAASDVWKGHLFTCALRPIAQERLAGFQRDWARSDPILNRIEDLCPQLFRPRRALTELEHPFAIRKYVDTGLVLWTDGTNAYYSSGQGDLVRMGRVKALMQGDAPRNGCMRPAKEKAELDVSREQLRRLRGVLD